jgi:hypothetical protein
MPVAVCRLCSAPLPAVESRRQLCAVCDDYVQHLSLRGNQRFEQTLSTVRDFWLFRQASKQAH